MRAGVVRDLPLRQTREHDLPHDLHPNSLSRLFVAPSPGRVMPGIDVVHGTGLKEGQSTPGILREQAFESSNVLVSRTRLDPAAVSVSIENRVFLVTGANSGIGKATALGLARMGGTVVMACRDATRGEAARQDIMRESGNPRVILEIVDLASEASTRSLAEAFRRKYPRLDVLINNAGVYTSHREITPDGLERQFEVNYLSGFLLTHLMLDLLKKSAPSRIVNVPSSAHRPSAIHFDDLQGERRY